ncbi:LacI family DNA-binding transcriptional regulator [Streptomyces sp. NBC_00322]|uniref:LacI family DNA-binding transcriptional regulator n=1 Tax=Streptomyces sp. NBC_00322 TaxID=2975712 RepID=UPI002E2C48B2|nr:LacI family DNA-binding transcriptional regulator [Streptomyces sp. NBC_00322]
MGKTRVTLADVAADAKVSRATVSLVLRESPLVAHSTRAKVRASMDRLGYVYHRGAASLRSRRSHTVGLLVTDMSNPFFAELTVGVEAALSEAGIVVLLGHNYESTAKQGDLIRVMQEYGADGLLITPAHETQASDLQPLVSARVPHLLVVRYVDGHPAPYVGADNVMGARAATEHLLWHGARRVAFLGGPEHSSARRDRRRGVEEALAARRRKLADARSVPTPATRQGGYDAALAMLRGKDRPDAIVCYSDVVAFGVILACDELGIRVGEEVRVTGFDDIAESALQHPALTTVAIRPRLLGERAARLLIQRIERPDGPPVSDVSVPELVVRSSCGCHPDEHEEEAR